MTHGSIIAATKQWVETVVVGLNLCPFARRPLLDGRVRFTVTDAETEAELIEALHSELSLLTEDPTVETTLLIHPKTLLDFYDFNDFLSIADDLVLDLALQGVVQIASFHPDYQFEGTAPDDIQNDTNRSPSPMLHLLREDSLARAIEAYPDVAQIPARNVALMQSMGRSEVQALLARSAETNAT
jgi:hypothetical protein